MPSPSVSVIVASHGRPTCLPRCLTALRQVDYPNFEIVIAADEAGLAAIKSHPARGFCKTVPCNEPNISATRNKAAVVASGEILAFIDDDSVPEPLWLRHHVNALEQTNASASVGYVRGRNGLTFQSQLCSVDAEAETHNEPLPEASVVVPVLAKGRAVKLVGTNFAIRRDVFAELCGMDEVFSFFLDDADLSLRLAKAGHSAAVSALAEVHHAFAASVRRTGNRRPTRLYDIGRSTALYIRRHGYPDPSEIWERIHKRESRRLHAHMVLGTCEPRDISPLLHDLRQGWDDGMTLKLGDRNLLPNGERPVPFTPVPALEPGHSLLSSRLLKRGIIRRRGEEKASENQRTTVFSFSLTPRRHYVRYLPSGVWFQTGGQFGRSARSQPFFRWCTFADRVKEERMRVELQRGIVDTNSD